ncbi:MAG: hypothetical protein AAF726_19370 [Planctomycetota bacterium]
MSRSDASNDSDSKAASAPASLPSIYEQILARLESSPDRPLETSDIETDDPRPEAGRTFAAGAVDGIFRSGDGSGAWESVLEEIRRSDRSELASWRQLEDLTAEVKAAQCVDRLLEQVSAEEVTPTVKARFWELATRSRRTESVKWGVEIGGVALTEAELPSLLVLARHAEFTLYCAHVLRREGERDPRLHRHLFDLLPTARGWGVVRLVEQIVATEGLIRSVDGQRELLIRAMENHDGMLMHITWSVTESIDLERFIREARVDERVEIAMTKLMDALLLGADEAGWWADLERREEIYAAWVEFAESHEADFRLLRILYSLRFFLRHGVPEWERLDEERARIDALWARRYSDELVRPALQVARDRWLALRLVLEERAHDLLPDVRRLHAQSPDSRTIEVLAGSAGEEDLQALLDSAPGYRDPEVRSQSGKTWEYGLVVRELGRHGTPEAVREITIALGDDDPYIRRAGCSAAATLSSDYVTERLRELLRERVADADGDVAEEARKAARVHGINTG